MALVMVIPDDQWPSLAPIRTTPLSSANCTCTSDTEIYQTVIKEQHFSHGSRVADISSRRNRLFSSSPAEYPAGKPNFTIRADSPNSDSAACSCFTKRFSCVHLLPNCFSCVRPNRSSTSTSPPSCAAGTHRRHCTLTCMRRNKYALRSLAFLSGMQSFYSSTPTQRLSGAFPRSHALSGKGEQYMSPRTPALNMQLSCKNSQFSSPRTPASSKVQHFSGAVPSPRTPFGPASAATSPASARRKKPSFTLVMPPGMMDKKKALEQMIIDEPSSPHVTCIGRVRRQTHCKKLLRTDTIDRCAHRRTIARKKCDSTTISSSKHNSSPRSNSQSQISTENVAVIEHSTIEACTQRFGKKKLLNLHKIQGYGGHEAGHEYNNMLFEVDQIARANGGEGLEDTTSSPAHGRDQCGVHVKSDHQESHIDNETALQTNLSKDTDCSADSINSAEIPPQLQATTCMLHEILNDDDAEAHRSKRCLLLIRNTSSRRLSEADRASLPEFKPSIIM